MTSNRHYAFPRKNGKLGRPATTVANHVDSVPYGFHWEIVHDISGDVVNSGFTRTDPPPAGPLKNPKGFTMRVTAVKRIDGLNQ